METKITVTGVIVFAVALVGELWVDIFQPSIMRPGYFMNVAIPLMVNLFLVGAAIRGSVKFRKSELSRTESPAKFFLMLAIVFVFVNSIVLYAILTQWFRQT